MGKENRERRIESKEFDNILTVDGDKFAGRGNKEMHFLFKFIPIKIYTFRID